MAKDQNKNIVDRVWDFMASIKLAIILFALIAITSIIGTIIEQNADPARNLQVLGSLFGEELAPTLYVFFDRLGFMDMYHSWWFSVLLMLFSANILICSLDRFPRIWKLVKDPVHPLSRENLKQIPMHKEFTLQGKPDNIREIVEREVRKTFTRSFFTWVLLFIFLTPIFIIELLNYIFMTLKTSEGDKETQIYAEKGRHTRLGVYVTHFSIIVILVGAVIGLFLGFKGQLNIPEGAAYAVAFKPIGMLTPAESNERRILFEAVQEANGDTAAAAARLGVEKSHLVARMKKLGMLPLDFVLRVEDFEVDFYGASDKPKEYSSILTVFEKGRRVLTKRIEVNDPLKYKGITFYQSSYGLMDQGDFRYVFRVASSGGQSETVAVDKGEEFIIRGTGTVARVTEFNPALAFDPTGRPFTYSQLMTNPAARLEITDNTGTYSKWVTKRNPQSWLLTSGDVIEFRDALGAQYTGLQVRKDPGVWIVYLGCTIMALGLYIAFFTNHKKLWVALSPSKGGSTSVTVAGSANKNREAFERKIDRMVSLLREGGK